MISRIPTKTNKKSEHKIDLLIDLVKDLELKIQELRRAQVIYNQEIE